MEFTVNKGSCGREILYEYETLCKVYQVLTGTEYIPKKGGPAYLRGGGSVGSKSTKSKGSTTSRSTKSEKKIPTANATARDGQPPLPPIGGEGEEEEEEEIRGELFDHLVSLFAIFIVSSSRETDSISRLGQISKSDSDEIQGRHSLLPFSWD
jgi:hypothetical protein